MRLNYTVIKPMVFFIYEMYFLSAKGITVLYECYIYEQAQYRGR